MDRYAMHVIIIIRKEMTDLMVIYPVMHNASMRHSSSFIPLHCPQLYLFMYWLLMCWACHKTFHGVESRRLKYLNRPVFHLFRGFWVCKMTTLTWTLQRIIHPFFTWPYTMIWSLKFKPFWNMFNYIAYLPTAAWRSSLYFDYSATWNLKCSLWVF